VKLAVFTTHYPARGATFFRRDMSALRAAGVDVDVFPIYPEDPGLWESGRDILGSDAIAKANVHHVGIGRSLLRAPWPLGRAVTFLRDSGAVSVAASRFGLGTLARSAYVMIKGWGWAADRARAARYDHVLAYWGNYAGTAAYAFHRLINRPIPFSIWLHAGTDLYSERKRVFLRKKIRYADTIVTCCEFNRGFMQAVYPDLAGQIESKTHVCYHGLDLTAFPYVPNSRPPGRVIAVGRLARFKGFDYLLRAAQICRQRGVAVDVEVVGDGPESGALKRLAQELGIAEHVVFRGYIPFSEVREAMSRSTILVHPSDGLGDGLPNVLREAMAVGTPVIASRVAGIPEALDDGRCGTLVPPKDVAALASAIETLLGDAARRHEFATRGRRRTEELFDLAQNGARLAERLRSTKRGPRVGAAV
jgi:colanic acid/amylovoran biosynthesis glycosyltransferase